MLGRLRNLFRTTSHLKLSTLTGQPSYYAYTTQGWQTITKARFDRMLSSGHFYQHEAASSSHELIYNRQGAKAKD